MAPAHALGPRRCAHALGLKAASICRQWQSQTQGTQSSGRSPQGADWEREQASHKAGLAALRAEKEALAAQNSQTWQLLEERTSEIHRLQVRGLAHIWMLGHVAEGTSSCALWGRRCWHVSRLCLQIAVPAVHAGNPS